jgi:hypothetical protein
MQSPLSQHNYTMHMDKKFKKEIKGFSNVNVATFTVAIMTSVPNADYSM